MGRRRRRPTVDLDRIRAGRGGAARGPARSRRPSPAPRARSTSTTTARRSPTRARRPGARRADRASRPRASSARPASVRHLELSRPRARRGRPARPAAGVDQRRGPRHEPRPQKLDRALHDLTTKGDKNPGRLKVAEQAVAQASCRVEQGELALAQLERDRDSLSARARTTGRGRDARWPSAARLLEKARQAERLIAERDGRQGTLRALSPGGRGQRPRSPTLATSHPSPERRCRSSARSSSVCGPATPGSASCGRDPVGRGRGPVRRRSRAALAAAVALVHPAGPHRCRSSRPAPSPPRRSASLDLGSAPR